MKSLTTVRFYGCDFYNLEALSSVKTVYIKNNNDEIANVKGLESLKNVENLQLEGFSELSLDGMEKFFKNVRTLDLRDSKYDITNLKLNDSAYPHMEKILLNEVDLTDNDQYNALVNILSRTPNLLWLGLDKSNLTENFGGIIGLLKDKSYLKTLSLNGSSFTSLHDLKEIRSNCEIYLNSISINGVDPTLLDYRWVADKKIHASNFNTQTIYDSFFTGNNTTISTLDGYDIIQVCKNKYTTVIIDNNKLYFGNSLIPDTYGNYDDNMTTWDANGDLYERCYTANGINYLYNSNIETPLRGSITNLDGVLYMFPDIEELYIFNCDLDINNTSSLKQIETLKKLCVSNCKSFDLGVLADGNLLELSELTIRNMQDVANINALEKLNLNNLTIDNVDIKVSDITMPPLLNSFELSNYHYDFFSYEDYLSFSKMKSLTRLVVQPNLERTCISDNNNFVDCILHLEKLEYLELNDVLSDLTGFERLESSNISEMAIKIDGLVDWSPLNWLGDNVIGRQDPNEIVDCSFYENKGTSFDPNAKPTGSFFLSCNQIRGCGETLHMFIEIPYFEDEIMRDDLELSISFDPWDCLQYNLSFSKGENIHNMFHLVLSDIYFTDDFAYNELTYYVLGRQKSSGEFFKSKTFSIDVYQPDVLDFNLSSPRSYNMDFPDWDNSAEISAISSGDDIWFKIKPDSFITKAPIRENVDSFANFGKFIDGTAYIRKSENDYYLVVKVDSIDKYSDNFTITFNKGAFIGINGIVSKAITFDLTTGGVSD